MKVKTALISVYDKTGVAEFAKELAKNGVKIISSGGTHKALSEAGIKCVKVEGVTGAPEMLDGRVKTLHQRIHAAILAKREPKHLKQLQEHEIEPIDLVVVNLYPFKETVSKKGASLEDAIENIDIGGPALIRGAAKNHECVGVVVQPVQYGKVMQELKGNGFSLSKDTLKELALEAFRHTAFYDSVVSHYLANKFNARGFPEKLALGFEKKTKLRYGENPHQEGILYADPLRAQGSVVDAVQLNGKDLSFNNTLDANSALEIVTDFTYPTVAIVKHNNPCGVASAKTISEAFAKALGCDKASAFGGVIAMNKACDLETARQVTSFFNEVVVAPSYEKNSLEELKKKQNLRVLELKGMQKNSNQLEFKQINGGLLVQEKDASESGEWRNVSGAKATKEEVSDLEFAWKVVKHVRSNAIVIAKDRATIGIGVGQTSRIDSTQNAIAKAGERAKGSVLASDGFFPFKDSIEVAAKAGVKAIVEPGGSIKDDGVIEEAKKQGIALFFTGERHFKH